MSDLTHKQCNGIIKGWLQCLTSESKGRVLVNNILKLFFRIYANIDKDTNKKLGSSHKYSKQTNCLTGQGNVIQDNIIVAY